jgi:hypothetical protein
MFTKLKNEKGVKKIQKVKDWYEGAKGQGLTIKEMLELAKKNLLKSEQAKLLILIAYDLDLLSADVVAVNSKWLYDL